MVGASLSRTMVTVVVTLCTVPPSASSTTIVKVRLVVGLCDEFANVKFSITRSAIAGVALLLKVTMKLLPVPPVAVPITVQVVPSEYFTDEPSSWIVAALTALPATFVHNGNDTLS